VGWRCINKNGKGQLSTYKELFAEMMLSGTFIKQRNAYCRKKCGVGNCEMPGYNYFNHEIF
jgi:hypothetical protein